VSTGEVYLAPTWTRGKALWRVELLAKPRNGSVLVRWLAGPLSGREARLGTKTLVREAK
jgi:hypothetical protein